MIKSILILDSSINEINIKNTNISDDILYKKCNMKNNNNFSKILDWNYSNYRIELWGKNKGINKFKSSFNFFTKLNLNIYGRCIFVMKDKDNNFISLNNEIFNNFLNQIDENNVNINNKIEKVKKIQEEIINSEDDSESSYEASLNSELNYEIYNYSSDEDSDEN
jgi:hypothetical protein